MVRGEIVIIVQGAEQATVAGDGDADRVLRVLLDDLPVSQAAKLAAQLTGRPRKELYERALRLRGGAGQFQAE